MSTIPYNRKALVHTLVYHQRHDIRGCLCGWSELGKSHPEHIANMYELAVTLGQVHTTRPGK